MSGLHIQNATVRFGATIAVDQVSLDVEQGTVLGLVGPSGCGKSTLLRSIAGLVPLDAGSIRWAGNDITTTPTHQRDVGLMFQHHALFSHRNVADNIGFGLRMKGLAPGRIAERVNELLELVGLDGFGPRSVQALSGGEAQRVALARALAPDPRLLLLDEPLASLDRARRVELNAELARLLSTLNQTAVYVTHDQEEAFAVADQVGVMHQGQLLRIGAPAEVWRDPQSEVVARFVGHETFVERDGRRYAVRADAVSLCERSGDLVGHVASCAFQGDRYQLGVQAEGQLWRLYSHDFVANGTEVPLCIDPTKLALVE